MKYAVTFETDNAVDASDALRLIVRALRELDADSVCNVTAFQRVVEVKTEDA